MISPIVRQFSFCNSGADLDMRVAVFVVTLSGLICHAVAGIFSCPVRGEVLNGEVTCSLENNIGSVCTVTCQNGTALEGSPFSECLVNGEWNVSLPQCNPTACPAQGALQNGSVSCTNGASLGSVCTFECFGEGYELYPEGRSRLVCEANQLWSQPRPCCTRPCPPYALMDLVIVLDSSSSIGLSSWNSLTAFVRGLIRSFIVAPDATNIAIFRYYRRVDEFTQIFLNDYPGDIDGLEAAFGRIPYRGGGSFTGRGLQHALRVSLAEVNGNRPDVPDVVMVLTDGRASDDVKTPADALRAAGATVLVVGVQPHRGQMDVEKLTDIAGNPENLLIAAGGFAGLDAGFATGLSRTICSDPCA